MKSYDKIIHVDRKSLSLYGALAQLGERYTGSDKGQRFVARYAPSKTSNNNYLSWGYGIMGLRLTGSQVMRVRFSLAPYLDLTSKLMM